MASGGVGERADLEGAGGRFHALRDLWRACGRGDRVLLSLRAAAAVGVGIWIGFAPEAAGVRILCAALLAAFIVYSLLLAWLVLRRPRRARRAHQAVLLLDLSFIYAVLAESGGIASPLLPLGLLLTAMTGVVHGPVLATAASVAVVCLAGAGDVSALAEGRWNALLGPLMLGVAGGLLTGTLARGEAQGRAEIERLRAELRACAEDMRAVERRCREVQDHLVHSERLATIGRMSAEMAHQVRNPLSSISLNLELIEDEVEHLPRRSREEVRRLLAAIHKEIDNLAEVTESYLRFAKLPPFRWEKTDLNEIVRETIVFARPRIEQRGVTVTQRLDEALGTVRLDRRQFKFAVMNVIANALEAMAPGGRLRIRTRAENGQARLMIADTGVGIRREEMEKIFDPFYTTKQGGTGLGLSLTRRIVESHGGRIACESIPMVGTTFTLTLPVDGAEPEEAAHEQG